MSKSKTNRNLSPKQSIFRWFLIGFISLSLVFFAALLPLISYCRNVFTDLEIQRSTQHMSFGISQLETTVTNVNNASQSLKGDLRFLPFYYVESDYSTITATTRSQMKEYLSSLILPLTLVSDWSLQFTDEMAVTPYRFIYIDDVAGYYPEFFQIDDLTFEAWEELLRENKNGFLPVHRINTQSGDYEALIYSIPWVKESYLYVCLNVRDIKQALVEKNNLDKFCLTIESGDGSCLYTDLSGNLTDYHSVTQKTSVGNLAITVHIPDTALTGQMRPLYSFLGIYLAVCVLVLITTIIVGSHLSSRPLVRIIDTLDGDTVTSFGRSGASPDQKHSLAYGFRYIHSKVQSYEDDLRAYRTTIDTQTKVLQARFMEKALHGSLATDADYEAFFSFFPEFPCRFCLILLGLVEHPVENENIYPNSLAMIQYYLQQSLPNAYQQQLTSMTMLLVIDENDYDEYSGIINHLMANINCEEPCYHAWGIASKFYDHPRSIPFAYWQMQDLRSRVSAESLSQLCTVSEFRPARKSVFQMSDTLSIYSAITNGNSEVALMRLDSYAEHLEARNRSIFEMFRSILLCVKQEYADLLIDVEIPFHHAQLDLYSSLAETISMFCDKFRTSKEQNESESFAQQVKTYIDLHFAEEDLCNTTLEEHFHCSFSKIRKAFSQEIGTPISAYIEAKRMALANELLIRGEDSVTEVARKCGFASYNTFHKAYRRVFGHAPTSIKPDK